MTVEMQNGEYMKEKTPFSSCRSSRFMPRCIVRWIITKMPIPLCISLFEFCNGGVALKAPTWNIVINK